MPTIKEQIITQQPKPIPPDLEVVLEELIQVKADKFFGNVTVYIENGVAFRIVKSENIMVKDRLPKG
jgi:hypothetical protein